MKVMEKTNKELSFQRKKVTCIPVTLSTGPSMTSIYWWNKAGESCPKRNGIRFCFLISFHNSCYFWLRNTYTIDIRYALKSRFQSPVSRSIIGVEFTIRGLILDAKVFCCLGFLVFYVDLDCCQLCWLKFCFEWLILGFTMHTLLFEEDN